MLVSLYFDKAPLCLERLYDGLTALKSIHSREFSGIFVHLSVVVNDLYHLKVMTSSDLKVVDVMSRSDLESAGSEIHFHVFVKDNGDCPVHKREYDLRSFEIPVSLIVRIDSYGGIAEHGFRTCGCHHCRAPSVFKRIAYVVEMAVVVLVFDFEIRQGRAAPRAPVDNVIAPVDQTFVVKLHKDLSHCLRQAFIHGEPFPFPVAGSAKPFLLIDNGAPVFLAPFPYTFQEPGAAKLMAVNPVGRKLLFHHVLGGDPCMVCPGHP